MNIPDDIYEAALAFVKRSDKKYTDNQRLAAMAGYCAGAIDERNGKIKK